MTKLELARIERMGRRTAALTQELAGLHRDAVRCEAMKRIERQVARAKRRAA